MPRFGEVSRLRGNGTNSPWRGSSLSQDRFSTTKIKPDRQAALPKALPRKESKTVTILRAGSMRESGLARVTDRRHSSPTPRKPVPSKTSYPYVLKRSPPVRVSLPSIKPVSGGRRRLSKAPVAQGKRKISHVERPTESDSQAESEHAPTELEDSVDTSDFFGEGLKRQEALKPIYPYLKLDELPPLDKPIRFFGNLSSMQVSPRFEAPPELEVSRRAEGQERSMGKAVNPWRHVPPKQSALTRA